MEAHQESLFTAVEDVPVYIQEEFLDMMCNVLSRMIIRLYR